MKSRFNNKWYTRVYYNIINQASKENRKRYPKNDPRYRYFEKHHIIPKSFISNNNEDVVLLTAKEHFICHLLLTKMCLNEDDTNKMVRAFWMLSHTRKGNKTGSRIYESIKRKISDNLSKTLKGKTYEELYGKDKAEILKKKRSKNMKGKPKSKEHRKQLSKAKKNYIPWNTGKTGVQTGWCKGLTKDTDERVKRMSENMKNKPKSLEHRTKLSEASKNAWANGAYKTRARRRKDEFEDSK